MANQPISPARARVLTGKYISYMSGLGVNMANQTHSISFTPALVNWMNTVMPFSDEIRIFLGVYPDGEPKAGRLTTILWPYKNGQPARKPGEEKTEGGEDPGEEIEPFNEGNGNP